MVKLSRRQDLHKENPIDVAGRYVKNGEDPSFLIKVFINDEIGSGVFTTADIKKGDFVVEYTGDVISEEEGEKILNSKEDAGTYLFFFKDKAGKLVCIDATKTERLGKYINDSTRFKNCKAVQFDYNGNPRLRIFATSDINKGTELRYNYNGHGLFWRSNKNTMAPYNLYEICNLQKKCCLCFTEDKSTTCSMCSKYVCLECISVIYDPDDTVVCNECQKQQKEDNIKESTKNVCIGKLQGNTEIVSSKTENVYELKNLPLTFDSKIGEGASAIVYKYKRQNKVLALKLFRNPLNKRKTIRIAEKLISINHQNVVQCFGYSLQPSCSAFEYCELIIDGEIIHNVSQLLSIWNDDELFIFSSRASIVMQASLGLKALHDMQIIHKDFKPSNLLVSGMAENIKVKLSDFDDLFILKNMTTATQTNINTLVGCTLMYSANEICQQTVASPSFETDIYSWAISTFEIMAGVPTPWSDVLPVSNDTLLLDALKANKRPSVANIIKRYAKDESDHIVPLICTCWDPDPNKRLGIDEMSQVDSARAEKTCLSHLYKLSIEWLQTCSSSKELITLVN